MGDRCGRGGRDARCCGGFYHRDDLDDPGLGVRERARPLASVSPLVEQCPGRGRKPLLESPEHALLRLSARKPNLCRQSAARLVLPALLRGFLAAHPGIRLEIVAEDSVVDVLAAGCDAGIRYDGRLDQGMIAVPIGLRVQRMATAAAPSYLDRHGRPDHPRTLLDHACVLGRFASGALTSPWEFERAGEIVRVEPRGPLIVQVGGATDCAVDAAIAGVGIISLFEDWLRPHLDSGALEQVLEDRWQPFSGPFLHYSDRRLVPPPLRAFIDFIKASATR